MWYCCGSIIEFVADKSITKRHPFFGVPSALTPGFLITSTGEVQALELGSIQFFCNISLTNSCS